MSRLISIICLLGSAAWGQIPSINWGSQKAEVLKHYRDLIQIDTSSPPGNETRAVEYLKKVFEAEGIPTKTFAVDPSRANLVARLAHSNEQVELRGHQASNDVFEGGERILDGSKHFILPRYRPVGV